MPSHRPPHPGAEQTSVTSCRRYRSGAISAMCAWPTGR